MTKMTEWPSTTPARSSRPGMPPCARAMSDAWLLSAPTAAAVPPVSPVSAAPLAQVLPEPQPPVPAQPPVLAQAPILAQRQVLAVPAHRLAGPGGPPSRPLIVGRMEKDFP